MDSRAYNASTARKRSTLMETKVIIFPQEGDSTPRSIILAKECKDELKVFQDCLAEKKDEAKCLNEKEVLNECAAPAFRMVNTTKDYKYE